MDKRRKNLHCSHMAPCRSTHGKRLLAVALCRRCRDRQQACQRHMPAAQWRAISPSPAFHGVRAILISPACQLLSLTHSLASPSRACVARLRCCRGAVDRHGRHLLLQAEPSPCSRAKEAAARHGRRLRLARRGAPSSSLPLPEPTRHQASPPSTGARRPAPRRPPSPVRRCAPPPRPSGHGHRGQHASGRLPPIRDRGELRRVALILPDPFPDLPWPTTRRNELAIAARTAAPPPAPYRPPPTPALASNRP